jgi:putative transposase
VTELRRKAPQIGIERLCRLFGKTRQAWYDRRRRSGRRELKSELVLELIGEVRRSHPRMGARKLHLKLAPDLAAMGLTLGRDALLDLMREHGLLVRKRRRATVTTNSRHRFRCYDNLLENVVVERPEQVWVSDITYLRLAAGRFCYWSLITDAYSHKVAGYHLHPRLDADGPLQALEMALHGRQYAGALLHHSDRGIQYCSHPYTGRLRAAGVAISMTYTGNGQNAIAERMNGILKDEYLLEATFESIRAARKQVDQAVRLYNGDRPHLSVAMRTPDQAHGCSGELKRLWRSRRRTAA